MRPTFTVEAGQEPSGTPVALPDGATLTLMQLDPARQIVEVQFGGVDLSKINPDDLKGKHNFLNAVSHVGCKER